jgi:predicted peptidase
MTRRDLIALLSVGCCDGFGAPNHASAPGLALGAPMSPERRAVIEAFQSEYRGLVERFDTRVHPGPSSMPYRLFRPSVSRKLPLVLYLHGSGGLGTDNEKQLALGNVFGTTIWALPRNQDRFPCYVVAPQTDRGWAKYEASAEGGRAHVVAGLGEGNESALAIVKTLVREFPIDEHRLYITGQSMGGAGVWNMIANRPRVFAAAAVCCGSPTADDVTRAGRLPLWVFHGDSDRVVPVATSRDRVAALRAAGASPIYTEYPGVDHNVWEWAYTEPALLDWMFSQRRK